MDLGLKNKTAVITGASVGIGLAVAEGLAAERANIVLAARGGERVSTEATRVAHGVRTYAVSCDVATAAGCAELIEATLWRMTWTILPIGTRASMTLRKRMNS